METINLQYGKTGLILNIPDNWDAHIIRKPKMPVLDNPVETLNNYFNNQVGCEPLSEAL